jgi:transposase
MMDRRCIGLDVHRDFCEVAVWEAGEVSSAGRVEARPEALTAFAEGLRPADEVAIEATSGARRIAELLSPHVTRVVIANTHRLAAISEAKCKTDRNDARTLAQLLAAGMLEGSWVPDEQTKALRRRVLRRHNLVVARTRVKNEVAAILHRNLSERPPMSDGLALREHLLCGAQLADDLLGAVPLPLHLPASSFAHCRGREGLSNRADRIQGVGPKRPNGRPDRRPPLCG